MISTFRITGHLLLFVSLLVGYGACDTMDAPNETGETGSRVGAASALVLTIVSPDNLASFSEGESVTFIASADEALTAGYSLVWRLDGGEAVSTLFMKTAKAKLPAVKES